MCPALNNYDNLPYPSPNPDPEPEAEPNHWNPNPPILTLTCVQLVAAKTLQMVNPADVEIASSAVQACTGAQHKHVCI